jgi:hypothetical protein
MAYRFRLRFHLPHDTNIELDDPLVEIPASLPDGAPYVLKAVGEKPIRETDALIINSRGFPTEEEAAAAGEAAKAALLYTATKLRFGVDVGRDQPMGMFGQVMKDQFRETHGGELRSDIHGLTVYDDSVETVFASISGQGSVGKSGAGFLQLLGHVLERSPSLSDKEKLALELFSSLHFEASLRARFLTLVTIVETLSENPSRPAKALAHVEKLEKETEKAELEPGERASILGALKWLRVQSIGQKTRSLVSSHLGETAFGEKRADKFFADCYEVRSTMTHYGKTPSAINLLMPELERLVAELLYAIVEKPLE